MREAIPPELLLADYPGPIRAQAEALRAAVRRSLPDVIERVRPGWRIIGYDVLLERGRSRYFAWIMIERQHVHLGFRLGVLMDDPEALLEGDAKLGRWTTYRPGEPIDPVPLGGLIREAARLARLGSSIRQGLLLDRELALVARRVPTSRPSLLRG